MLAYVIAVGSGGALVEGLLLREGFALRLPGLLAFLVVAMVVAESFPMEVPWRNQNLQFTLSSTFGLMIMFLHGPVMAATIQAVLWIVTFSLKRKGWMKVVFNGGQLVLCYGAAATVARSLGVDPGDAGLLTSRMRASEVLAIVASLATFLALNTLLTAVARAISSGGRVREVLKACITAELVIELAALLLVPVLLLASRTGLLLLGITCIPMVGFYFAIKVALQNAVLLEEKQRGIEAQREAEQQLRQAQKMEAFGQLAGGVAHDFNNLLSVILNYASFAREDLSATDPARDDIEEIVKAGERAARLTRQLLSFSRQDVLDPQVLQINEVVFEMDKMLRRTIGEHIEMRTVAGDAPLVRIDRGQFEQIVLNLALNARDAMPRGGTLVIETDRVMLEAKDNGTGEGPIDHARLRVRDTGNGISPQNLERIFEPFFTTKERGQGTGLGLATVYGAVRQCGGWVDVTSDEGHGTEFTVVLPATVVVVDEPQPERDRRRDLAGHTVLLVEDEDAVRAMVTRVLRRFGAEVLAAASGPEALDISSAYPGPIDILITDVVMPQMSGKDLAVAHVAHRPDTPVLFMSGYTDSFIAEQGVLSEGEHFLQKPFVAEDLRNAVAQLLVEGGERRPEATERGLATAAPV